MIVDLNLKNWNVLIIGGGNEGLKKIKSLLPQKCKILLISETQNQAIQELVSKGKIQFKKGKIKNGKFLSDYNPDLVFACTNDKKLNNFIIKESKKKHCLCYASDDPNSSDFSLLSTINIKNTVQLAISTGGKSPAMARKICLKSEKLLEKTITKEDINQIKLQDFARKKAKNYIKTTSDRKKFLYSLMNDAKIKELLKDDLLKKAQGIVVKKLEGKNE